MTREGSVDPKPTGLLDEVLKPKDEGFSAPVLLAAGAEGFDDPNENGESLELVLGVAPNPNAGLDSEDFAAPGVSLAFLALS